MIARGITVLTMLLTIGMVRAADRPNIVFVLADDLGWSNCLIWTRPA